MKPEQGKLVRRWFGYVWLCLLGIALVVSGLSTDRRARQVEEYACFCDPYGYLQSAREIRQAAAARRLPDFSIDSPHSRLLIDMLNARGLPDDLWDELVAPLCHRYFPRTDRIGGQYPPGTGILLAFFPEGRALHGLDRVVIIILVGAGLALLLVAAVRQAWLSAGFLVFSLTVGLEMLARIDNASFSINAMFVPIVLSSLCLCMVFALLADSVKASYWASLAAAMAGLFFGFAILVRLQMAFLLPGLIALLWPASLRRWYKSGLAGFLLGVFLVGVPTIAIIQSRLAGAWYLPTYGAGNTDAPALKTFWPNLRFYFQQSKPSQFNWVLLVMAVAYLGLFIWSRRRIKADLPTKSVSPLSWGRVGIATVLMWVIPTLYFLSHEITIHYYPLPTIFVTALTLALCAFKLEVSERAAGRLRRTLQLAAFTLAFVPGLVAIGQAWSNYVPSTMERKPRQFTLPAELADVQAWVWAAELSGTVGYYAGKAAHKIDFASPDTRLIVYKFVRSRGEPQYLINDGSGMQRVQDEMVRFGAVLEPRGEVDGYPYFLIHWPPDGPSTISGITLARPRMSDAGN
jgi:hypothetical protein